jgi:hypothetical protein
MGERRAKVRSYQGVRTANDGGWLPSRLWNRVCGGVYMSKHDGQNNLTVSMAGQSDLPMGTTAVE